VLNAGRCWTDNIWELEIGNSKLEAIVETGNSKFGTPNCKLEQVRRPVSSFDFLTPIMVPRLKERYGKEIVPALMKEFSYGNVAAVPRLRKIVVNMGLGEAIQNAKLLDSATQELALITGQKPVITRARRSIANFKLRKSMPIGAMVTLRGNTMYEFFDRLANVVLPRVRDFRGLSTRAFDGRGNYTLGLRDQLVFPEVDYAKVDKIKGMNISIVTDARTDAEALALLRHLGMPMRQETRRRAPEELQEQKAGG
jgi:large subunit ribosomal protein L5